MTDVMEETIGAIGVLNQGGIKMLHVRRMISVSGMIPLLFFLKDWNGNKLIVVTVTTGFNYILHFAFTSNDMGSQTSQQVKKYMIDYIFDIPIPLLDKFVIPYSFRSPIWYSCGVIPSIFLNTLLKWKRFLNPHN